MDSSVERAAIVAYLREWAEDWALVCLEQADVRGVLLSAVIDELATSVETGLYTCAREAYRS